MKRTNDLMAYREPDRSSQIASVVLVKLADK